jgi:hypothetical protein
MGDNKVLEGVGGIFLGLKHWVETKTASLVSANNENKRK